MRLVNSGEVERRFLLAPTPRLVAIPCSPFLSVPIWPPVEASRLGDISIEVTPAKGDISNVATWGHYQSRATGILRTQRTQAGIEPQEYRAVYECGHCQPAIHLQGFRAFARMR